MKVFIYFLCIWNCIFASDPTNEDLEELVMPEGGDDSKLTAKEILFGLDDEERSEKSLLNTFPFNIDNHGHHDHHGHHEHHGEHHDEEQNHHHNHEGNGHHENSHEHGIQEAFNNIESRNPAIGASFPFADRIREASKPTDENEEGTNTEVSLNSVITNGATDGDRKCIDKVMMVEETVYDEVITCDHSYDQRCHTSYVTHYESQQEEECEENYKKICMIDYEDLAYNTTVEICKTPLVKDCDLPGETVCQTIYESECATVQKVHEVEDDVTSCRTEQMKKCKEVTEGYTTREDCEEWPVERCEIERKKVKKYTPETKCYKEPRELCAPRGCGFKNGSIECHTKAKTLVVENPVETCDVEPIRTCKHVTKLVPVLVPVEECADVPKEICARSKTNPRKVNKPVIKKWCYVPSKESGLL